jgi:hypothetical protein
MESNMQAHGTNQSPAHDARRRTQLHLRVVVFLLAFLVLASCERTPSKSDYVSAQVTALCAGKKSGDLRACRIAVIKQFSDTPLEEMQRRFPKPEPRERPGCNG